QTLVAKIRRPRPAEDHHLDWAIARMHAERSAAVIADRPHIATAEAVANDHRRGRFCEFLARVRNLNSVDRSRRVESVEVRIHPKDSRPLDGIVTAHTFEHSAPVVKRMRGHVHGCVAPVRYTTVHPYPICFIE